MKALRDHFSDELIARARVDERIVAIDCDVQTHSRLSAFALRFPDRFYQAGASEQHALSLAAGLSKAGRLPVVASFATFISARAFEQARNSIGLQSLPILIVGSHAGFAAGEDGASHQAYDDIGLFSLIPTFHVYAPADLHDLRDAMDAALVRAKSVYLRYGRRTMPVLDCEDCHPDQFRTIKKCNGSVIITAGEATHRVIEALGDRSDVSIVHTGRVRPLPELPPVVLTSDLILVVEDHYAAGGLFGAVCEAFSEIPQNPKIVSVSAARRFGETGHDNEVMAAMGLDSASLRSRVRSFIKNNLKAEN
ncbi:transketolase family protein [Rhizobium rhizogenes]|uniref:transketolase family protein n=1 Tax=Rhizobium rhizogenes TaxID=359 RepID=UPI001573E48A|nr:hypothetical protein [Rhizobium rhizogenes]NTI76599.1 hypothetical protein [Rhizobium rhizogenes]